MNKNEYLKKLDMLLQTLPYDERRDIMYDYEEHFKAGIDDGKTEEEIINDLGSPEKIASQYVATTIPYSKKPEINKASTYTTQKTIDPGRSIVLGIIMILFNLIFVVGIYLGLWGGIIGISVGGLGIFISGIVACIGSIFSLPFAFLALPVSFINYPLLGICASIALISLGGLLIIGCIYIIKYYCILTIKYVKWNIKVVRGW